MDDEAAYAHLCTHASILHLSEGHVLVEENAVDLNFYLCVSGKIEIRESEESLLLGVRNAVSGDTGGGGGGGGGHGNMRDSDINTLLRSSELSEFVLGGGVGGAGGAGGAGAGGAGGGGDSPRDTANSLLVAIVKGGGSLSPVRARSISNYASYPLTRGTLCFACVGCLVVGLAACFVSCRFWLPCCTAKAMCRRRLRAPW